MISMANVLTETIVENLPITSHTAEILSDDRKWSSLSASKIIDAMSVEHKATISYRRGTKSITKSYADIRKEASRLAIAIRNLGVQRGDVIAIHGETSIDWLLLDFAASMLGATSLALYPNAPLARIQKILDEISCKIIFTNNTTYADAFYQKNLTVGLLDTEVNHKFKTVEALITSVDIECAGDFQLAIDPLVDIAADDDEVFTIVSTSGTLSDPRLFGVSIEPLIFTMKQFAAIYSISADDTLLLFLPLSHLPQRMIVYGCLVLGTHIVLSDTKNFLKDAKHYEPTITVTVPRVLEYIMQKVEQKIAAFNPELYSRLESQPQRKIDHQDVNVEVGEESNFAKSIFGNHIKTIFVGSAPTATTLMRKLLMLGFPIYEVYGTTELGMIALNMPGKRRVGYAGMPIPWGQVTLNSDKEIMVNTQTPFLWGFVKQGSIVRHDWLSEPFPSGDIGEIEDGFIRVVSRVKDFCALANGEKIFVNTLENKLNQQLPRILSVIIGNGEKHLRALFFNELGENIDLDHLLQIVNYFNQEVHILERIRYIAIWNEMPRIEDGCITDTLKIRRHKIEEQYKDRSEWIQLF